MFHPLQVGQSSVDNWIAQIILEVRLCGTQLQTNSRRRIYRRHSIALRRNLLRCASPELAHLRSHGRRPRRLVTESIPVTGLVRPTVDGCDNLTHTGNPSPRSQGSAAPYGAWLKPPWPTGGAVIGVLRQWAPESLATRRARCKPLPSRRPLGAIRRSRRRQVETGLCPARQWPACFDGRPPIA
jgi:hypothetical protein